MKICTKCNQNLDNSLFPKNKRFKDGLNSICKSCINKQNKKYRDKNKSKFNQMRRKYYQKNIDKMRAEKRKYYQSHKEQKAEYDKQYRIDNADKIKQYKQQWEQENRSIERKIKTNLRSRVYRAVKYGYKSKHTMELLGCTIDQFLDHLESQFQPGMTWENYGSDWHIDHIQPCASFDLTNPSEQEKCFHYTNCQPLWKEDNLKKGCTQE